ncbi:MULTISPECIES: hypothetical protein [unclassified Halomonas]|jgi:hypothetical protein|uniref:hypothetical protein n=1 Tax=unclassified Halomonas TaxID=2609666 RepID=UPI0002881D93|nr:MULTISPECIES: hypothetical protein [unclassified Halomonas]MCE8040460.1 hypothetical protein [Halomonas sp. MCCC 1A11062]
MTRRKKTRSLADKVTIRTGKRKDYKKWRHENPDQVTSSRRFTQKKRQQRKLQAARKLARQEQGASIAIHPTPASEQSATTREEHDE